MKSCTVDTRFKSVIVLLIGRLIDRFAEMVTGRSLDGMAVACADMLTKVSMGVVEGDIGFRANLVVP